MNTPVSALALPPGRKGAGRYTIRVDMAKPLDDAGMKRIQRLLNLFCDVGNKGAFPAPGCPPAASQLRIGELSAEEPYRALCRLEAHDVDLLAFELLRNMGDRLVRERMQIRQFLISNQREPTDVRLKPPATWENELDAYPPISSSVRFRLAGEGTDVGKLRRCLIELKVPVEASHVNRLDQWLASWLDILEAGAYSLPVGPAWETDCIRGTISLFDEATIELVVDRFQSSDTAWHALINMVDACWPETSPVAQVVVD